MKSIATVTTPVAELKDLDLFREACYLDGEWVQASSGQTISVDNPASSEIIGKVPKLGAAETKKAIEAANRALLAWSKKTAKERRSSRKPASSCGMSRRSISSVTWKDAIFFAVLSMLSSATGSSGISF